MKIMLLTELLKKMKKLGKWKIYLQENNNNIENLQFIKNIKH